MLNTQSFLSLLSRTLTHHQGGGRCHLPITILVSWDSVPSFNLYTYRLGNRDPYAHFLGKKTSPRRCNIRLYLIFKSIQQILTDSYNRSASWYIWLGHAIRKWPVRGKPPTFTPKTHISASCKESAFSNARTFCGTSWKNQHLYPSVPPLILIIWWWCRLQR